MKLKIFYILILLPYILNAQVLSGTVDYSLFYDDNPLRQNDGSEEYINSFQTRLDFQPFEKEFYLFYSGGFDAFRNLSSRNYQNHYFGVNYAFALSDSSVENIFTGLNYSLKKGTSDYAVYDFNQVFAFLNGNFHLADNIVLQPGYRIAYKNFPELYNLTYTENLGTLGLSAFFETKTGLFLQTVLGNKNYSTTEVLESVMSPGKQQGKGRRSFQSITNEINITQLRTSVKISQSLSGSTGSNIYYLNRTNLSDNKQNFQSTELIYSDDSDLWDDPYGFESNEIGFEITQMLPLSITAKFSVDYAKRRYLNNAADSLNLTQRLDDKTEIWTGISKSFNSVPLLESIELGLEYMYIINKSNTGLFDYKNNLLQFSLQFGF